MDNSSLNDTEGLRAVDNQFYEKYYTWKECNQCLKTVFFFSRIQKINILCFLSLSEMTCIVNIFNVYKSLMVRNLTQYFIAYYEMQ